MSLGTIINSPTPAEILLVQADNEDVLLTQKAFAAIKVNNNITVARDGEEALALLRRQGQHAGTTAPDLILLDLNLPTMSGKDVLNAITSDETLKSIPVVILARSLAELHAVKSDDLQACAFIVKPITLNAVAEVVLAIKKLFFTLVVFPEHC